MFEGPNTTTTDDHVVDHNGDHTVDHAGPCDGADSPDPSIEGVFFDLLEPFIGVPPVVLNDHVGDIELRRRVLDAEMAAGIHAIETSGSFGVDGHRSMTAYLKARFNWSGGHATTWLKIARFITVRTCVGDAWAAGRIGFDQVLELHSLYANRRARHAFDQLLPVLLLQAEQLLFTDFQIVIATAIATADQDGAHVDRDTAIEHRNAHMLVNGAELDVSVIGGDPVTAAEIVAIFDLAVQHEFDTDVAARALEFGDGAASHPLPRTAGQRRHDAFLRIQRAGGAVIANDVNAGTRSVAKIVVRVLIDEATFRQILTDAGLAPAGMIRDAIGELVADPTGLLTRTCQLSDGTPIHPHDALRALLDGYVQRVVIDTNSVVVDLGRESRLFTGSARQAALILVNHCDHPGCDLPAQFCDIDHNIEWADGGRTDQNNARPRCSTHNRFKSRNRWRSQQATNGYHYTIRDDGTIVLPIGARPPTLREPDTPTEPATAHLGYEPEDPADIEHLNTIARQRAQALRAA
jgi:hypothetical protein